MLKKILILVVVLYVIFILIGGKFKWLIVDMGWCQKYGKGLKIGNTVILQLPQGPTTCV